VSTGRYIFRSVIPVCVTFVLYRVCQWIGEAKAEQNRSIEEFRRAHEFRESQVHRHSQLDSGDCVPVRLIETDDETRLVIIGDYRKDTFAVLQRFQDGYRLVYPSALSPSVKSALIRLEATP
jgi:hypothetical protein